MNELGTYEMLLIDGKGKFHAVLPGSDATLCGRGAFGATFSDAKVECLSCMRRMSEADRFYQATQDAYFRYTDKAIKHYHANLV